MRSRNHCGLFGVFDVHELQGKRAAIGAAQDVNDLAHGRIFHTHLTVDENLPVEIVAGKPIPARIE